MAANKFATMLHRKSNKITLTLIYAFLEWTLIILLLLNSLFSYIIIKFAEFFGLKPPCPLCSRVDHLFEHENNTTLRRDLLCEAHATEISKQGFCTNHHKLAETKDMCEDCSSSRPDFRGVSEDSDLFPCMKEIHNGHEEVRLENGEVSLKCSCCSVNLESQFSTTCVLIKPSNWDDLAYTQKGNLVIEAADDGDVMDKGDNLDSKRTDIYIESCGNEVQTEDQVLSDVSLPVSEVRKLEDSVANRVEFVFENVTEYVEEQDRERVMKDEAVQVCVTEESFLEIPPRHLDFFIECSGRKLVPVELIDPTPEEDHDKKKIDEVNLSSEEQEFTLVAENKTVEVEEETTFSFYHSGEEPKFAVLDSVEIEEEESGLFFYAKAGHSVTETFEKFDQTPTRDSVQFVAERIREGEEEDVSPVSEEVPINETDAEVLIGTEIPDLNIAQVALTHEEPSSISVHFHEADQHGPKVELKISSHVMTNQPSLSSNLIEIEVPETPTCIDSFLQLQKKLLLVEKKDSGEEFLVSELDTVSNLKSALKAERKALHTLYTELEEERSASAVAANQTMAMINKLQEEKAAMQMEALQYQRMMEEQSEYDQEALQLLNELMVKREKEKQELEKELEVYRKRLSEYEAKDRMGMSRRSSKDGTGLSSASCSNAEDSDELSIDLNEEAKEEDSFYGLQESENHVDAVAELEESFADFEEERMSILEQLKMLEEKLITMDDEDGKHTEDSCKENGNHLDGEINEDANGFTSEMNGNADQGKGLYENDFHSDELLYMTKKLAVEEELDHLHGRLQALEADREFLKNCISSLRKGDKGMDLLHEILQHLRDLRNLDLRVRSSSIIV